MMEVLYASTLETSTVRDVTFDAPDLSLDDLGLVVVGQRVDDDGAVLACRAVGVEADRWCRVCGGEGTPRDSVVRRLAGMPR